MLHREHVFVGPLVGATNSFPGGYGGQKNPERQYIICNLLEVEDDVGANCDGGQKRCELGVFDFPDQGLCRGLVGGANPATEAFHHAGLLPIVRDQAEVLGDLLNQRQRLCLAHEEVMLDALSLRMPTADKNHHAQRQEDEQCQTQDPEAGSRAAYVAPVTRAPKNVEVHRAL